MENVQARLVSEEINTTVISLCKLIREKVESNLTEGLAEVVKATADLVSAADRMLY
ncbi:hypothetical protein [Paenibacillus oryzisoli]|uniref:hypothetical protein n=1 Tax=Paenibacillus oryzisoli TaxID=1850517 RepID=UPI0012FA43D5|nr:hypothetical protein [Paenibacillus oryzisoli]